MALPKPWTGPAPPFRPSPIDEFTSIDLPKPRSRWKHIPKSLFNIPVHCDRCLRSFTAFSPGIYGKPCNCGGHIRPGR